MDESGLEKTAANYAPLTPLGFLERSALVYPSRYSVVHLQRRFTWQETYARCRCLASALRRRGISKGDTVAVLGPNVPAVYEAHFGVPMAGAVLNAINIRLDAKTVSLFFSHSEAKLVIVDYQFLPLAREAIELFRASQRTSRAVPAGKLPGPQVVVIEPEEGEAALEWDKVKALSGEGDACYEAFLSEGDPEFRWSGPQDEEDAISLNYTSGTTSSPKGVVYSHRGAYLAGLTNAIGWGMHNGCVYLWTLPLFHCNGWCFPWTVAALAGTNICMRQVTAKAIFSLIAEHKVTHFCGAPVVLNFLVNAPPEEQQLLPPGNKEGQRAVHVMTAGAAPPPPVLAGMEGLGFRVTHTYGLTETYGPAVMCEWKEEWDALPLEERARLRARQGVRYLTLEGLDIMDATNMSPVTADGKTQGEVMMRGNLVMKGYLKNPEATRRAFEGGWFHSGDIAVKHPDSYIDIKDRSKDVIISGGENISSIEVESIIHRHPAVMECAVVARPDDQWGESVCAFLNLKPGHMKIAPEDIIEFCLENMPRYMVPRTVIFQQLPKTATGKIQKYVLRKEAGKLGSLQRASSGKSTQSRRSKL